MVTRLDARNDRAHRDACVMTGMVADACLPLDTSGIRRQRTLR
jgi:hypothetical protein